MLENCIESREIRQNNKRQGSLQELTSEMEEMEKENDEATVFLMMEWTLNGEDDGTFLNIAPIF